MNIFVTRNIPDEGLQKLRDEGHNVMMWDQSGPMTKVDLAQKAKEVDALITTLSDSIDESFLRENAHLKIIANYRASFGNIHVPTASELKIPVTCTPRVNHDAVAEFALGLMLSLARFIPEAHSFVIDGKFACYDPKLFQGQLLKGKTLGIIGMGNVGQRLGKMCALGLGMNVLYHDQEKVDLEYKADFVSIDDLLSQSDVISIHLPPLPSSNGKIGHSEFQKMKHGVIIVNTSLAHAIHTPALLQNLRSKKVAGVACDIVTQEGRDNESIFVREMQSLPHVLLTPQISSSTMETRRTMAEMVADDILKVSAGEQPQYIVNPEIYG